MKEYNRTYGMPEGANVEHLVDTLQDEGWNVTSSTNEDFPDLRLIRKENSKIDGKIELRRVLIQGIGNGYDGLDKILDKYTPVKK